MGDTIKGNIEAVVQKRVSFTWINLLQCLTIICILSVISFPFIMLWNYERIPEDWVSVEVYNKKFTPAWLENYTTTHFVNSGSPDFPVRVPVTTHHTRQHPDKWEAYIRSVDTEDTRTRKIKITSSTFDFIEIGGVYDVETFE